MSEAVIEEGVEEQENGIPELPEGWILTTLGEVTKLMRNGWTRKQVKTPTPFPISRIETIANDQINPDRVRFIEAPSPEDVRKWSLESGDILISHINSPPQVGRAVLYQGDPPGLLHGMNLLLLRVDREEVDPRFLVFQLAWLKARGEMLRLASHAVNQCSINQRSLSSLSLVLPAIETQRILKDQLEHRFGEISELNAQLDVVENLQDQFRQALLRDAFSGRLTHGDALSDSDEVDEAGRPALPESWRWRPLKELGDLVRGVTYKKPQASSEGGPGLIRLLRATNISDRNGGSVDLEESLFVPRELVKEVQILREGDLLMVSSSGSRKVVGKSTMLDGGPEDLTFGAFCTVFRPNGGVLSSYLRWLFRGPTFRSMISEVSAGSNINNLKRDDLLNLEVPVPNTEEQAEIARVVQAQLDQADEVEQFISEVRAQLESVRASLLHQAFSGQLVT